MEVEINQKKRRKRPHTKQIRFDLKAKLESAVLSPNSQILDLFKINEENPKFQIAPLSAVLERLGLKNTAEKLSSHALRSMSKVTKAFFIDGSDKELKILFNTKKRENLEDTIVYVDNLPALCSASKLRRRASVFGTVVNIHLPQPKRIRNRFNRHVYNVGYGFVQFSTVKAAKRFIFKYAANSHLRRHKHSRHSKARRRKLGKDKLRERRESSEGPNFNYGPDPESEEPQIANGFVPYLTPSSSHTTDMEYEYAVTLSAAATPAGERVSRRDHVGAIPVQTSSQEVQQELKEVQETPDVSFQEPPRERKITEVSESGNETELDVVEKKRIKRRRKKRKRRPPTSLTSMLRKIQVFSLKQYKELRAEYLKLKKDRMSTLKKILVDESEKLGLANGQDMKPKETKENQPKQHKRSGRRRKRPSGKERLMRKAAKIKDIKFDQLLYKEEKASE